MELNLRSNTSNTLASNANFYDIRGGQPQAQAEPVSMLPLGNAADLSSHPSARNLQNYSSIRPIAGGADRFAFDHLSQPAKLEAIEAALRQYDTLNAEEKTKVIAAAVQFINSVRLDAKPYEKVTLFIGQTGAGKSTLINYLAGAEIKGKWDEELNTVSLDIPKMLKDIRVGHGAASCTFAPMPYEDTATGLVYFDCPGFMDSRGILHEIIAAKLIQDVIRNAEKVNFVITLTESCLADRGHIRVLKETIDVLETYAPDFEASKNSMLLVVTKGANNKNFGEPGDEEDDIKYFKAKVAGKSGILNELDNELSAYQKAFLQFIHDKGRFTYSFKADIKKDTPVSTAERERIIRKIQELELVPHQEISGIKISRDAELRSIEFSQHIKTCLNGLSEQLPKTAFKNIADFCSQKVSAGADLFDQDITALQAMLKKLQRAVIPLVTKQYDTAEVFFENLQTLLTDHDIHLAEDTLQAIHTLLADIKGHESAQSLFRKICDLDIEASNTKLMFTQGFIPLSQTLKRLIPACDALQAYQPIKPGLPYMEKFADEAENTVKVEMLLKHAQDHEKLGHLQDAEEAYGKALKHTDSVEHYKLYAACLREIYLALSRIPLTPEKDVAKEKAYQEKASRAFYYLGELYVKQAALEDAKNAYKASCDLALHEAALQALIHVARQLEDAPEVAVALEKLASFYEQKGNIPSAIESLEEAFKVLPSVKVLENLAALYGQAGGENSQSKVDKTRIMRFELQISQDPKNIELYRDYGWFLKSIGKHNEARAVKKRIDVQLQAIQRELFQNLQQNFQTLEQKLVKQKTKVVGLKQTIHLQDEKIHSQAGKLETLEKQVEYLEQQVILLDFSNRPFRFYMQDKDLMPLLEKNPYIKLLNLQGCEHLTDAVLRILPERFANLQELNLSGCKGLTEVGLDAIAENASKLKHLTLDYCPGTTIKLLHKLNAKGIAFTIEGVTFKPKRLNLSNRHYNDTLTDDELRQALEANPEITELSVSGCQKITDAGLAPLKDFQWLTSLTLFSCSQLSDECLQHLPGLTQLTELNLGCCNQLTGAGLKELAGLSQLTKLNLGGCSQLTDAGLKELAGLSQLTSLAFDSTHTNAGLQHLAGLTRLRSLYLSYCKQLTDECLQHLAGLTQLTELNLSGCEQLTDKCLLYLEALPQLFSLKLDKCQKITSNAKAQLKQKIPRLYING